MGILTRTCPPTATPTWESLQELKLLQSDPVITPSVRCSYSSRGRWDLKHPRTGRTGLHPTDGPPSPPSLNYSDRMLRMPEILERGRIPDPFYSDPVFELYNYSILTRRNL